METSIRQFNFWEWLGWICIKPFDWWGAFKPGCGTVIAKTFYSQKNLLGGRGAGIFYNAPNLYHLVVEVQDQFCHLVVAKEFYDHVNEGDRVPVFYQQRRFTREARLYTSPYPWDIDKVVIQL